MSGVKGVRSFRRLLRRLPEDARKEMGDFLEQAGNRLLSRAKAETPRRTGAGANALRKRLARATLRLTVGLTTPRARRRFFYLYILDQGRKAKTVRIRKGPRAGKTMRISAIPRERFNFVFGRRADFIANDLPKMKLVLDRALKRAASGAGND